MKKAGPVLAIAVKLTISIALIWYAFSTIDTASAFRLLRSIDPGFLLLAVASLAFQQVLLGLRLARLLRLIGAPVRIATAIDAVFVGLFFGTTFVSFISGDAMRVWRLTRTRVPVAAGFQAIVFDRIFGMVTLIAMIAMGLPLLAGLAADRAMRLSILGAVVLGVAGVAAFLFVSRLPQSWRRWGIVRLAADTSAAALSLARSPLDVTYLLAVSLALQSLNVIGVFLIARGLGVDAGLLDLMVLIPPVVLLTLLPVSFAGWGVRESAMVVVLGLLGVGANQSVAVSVCFGLCMTAVGLPGGVIWFLARREAGSGAVAGPAATP